MYGRPDVYYVRDSGELSCADCAMEGASMRDLDNLPRRARAAMRLAEIHHGYGKYDPYDVVRLLEDSGHRGVIYGPGPWEGLPRRQGPDGRWREMSGEEYGQRCAMWAARRQRTIDSIDAIWSLFGVVHDWDMDSREGEYCGGCHKELSPAWGTCDNCGHEDAMSVGEPNYRFLVQNWWPDDAVITNDGDGSGPHVDKCNYCVDEHAYS